MQTFLAQPNDEARIEDLSLRLKQAKADERKAWAEAASYRLLLRQCSEAAKKQDCKLVYDTAQPVVESPFENGQISKGGASFLEDFDRKKRFLDCALHSLEQIRAAAELLPQGSDPVRDIREQILALVQQAT
jgi:hypothetical protein